MRTPKEYTTNLKNNIITAEMLADCVYSVNERAKNYRDKADEYRNDYDPYNNEEKYVQKLNEMYLFKNKLLSLVAPAKCVENKIYSYWEECIYSYSIDEMGEEHSDYDTDVPNENEYDYKTTTTEKVYEWDEDYGKDFHYGKYEEVTRYYKEFSKLKKTIYYHAYKIKEHEFLLPITQEEYENSELEKISISDLKTKVHGNDLISMNFVKKVLELIESNNYTLEVEYVK